MTRLGGADIPVPQMVYPEEPFHRGSQSQLDELEETPEYRGRLGDGMAIQDVHNNSMMNHHQAAEGSLEQLLQMNLASTSTTTSLIGVSTGSQPFLAQPPQPPLPVSNTSAPAFSSTTNPLPSAFTLDINGAGVSNSIRHAAPSSTRKSKHTKKRPLVDENSGEGGGGPKDRGDNNSNNSQSQSSGMHPPQVHPSLIQGPARNSTSSSPQPPQRPRPEVAIHRTSSFRAALSQSSQTISSAIQSLSKLVTGPSEAAANNDNQHPLFATSNDNNPTQGQAATTRTFSLNNTTTTTANNSMPQQCTQDSQGVVLTAVEASLRTAPQGRVNARPALVPGGPPLPHHHDPPHPSTTTATAHNNNRISSFNRSPPPSPPGSASSVSPDGQMESMTRREKKKREKEIYHQSQQQRQRGQSLTTEDQEEEEEEEQRLPGGSNVIPKNGFKTFYRSPIISTGPSVPGSAALLHEQPQGNSSGKRASYSKSSNSVHQKKKVNKTLTDIAGDEDDSDADENNNIIKHDGESAHDDDEDGTSSRDEDEQLEANLISTQAMLKSRTSSRQKDHRPGKIPEEVSRMVELGTSATLARKQQKASNIRESSRQEKRLFRKESSTTDHSEGEQAGDQDESIEVADPNGTIFSVINNDYADDQDRSGDTTAVDTSHFGSTLPPRKTGHNRTIQKYQATQKSFSSNRSPPMGRRTGKKACAAPPLSDNDDDDGDGDGEEDEMHLPAPLSTQQTVTADTRRALSPRHKRQKSGPSSSATTTKPDSKVSSNSKRNRNEVSEPRRSTRRSLDKVLLKFGQTFPFKDYVKIIEAARDIIQSDGQHAAGLQLDRMPQNDTTHEFVDTQLMHSKMDEDTQTTFTRTWQVFIYCRNRSALKPPSEKTKRAPQSDSSPRSNTSHDGTTPGSQVEAPKAGQSVTFIASPVRSVPENIYKHRTDANCPAQIAACLVVDPDGPVKAYWRIDQVVDHCLQCHNLDAEIGKGAPDLTKVREDYFDYWSTQFDKQLKVILTATNNFKKRPKDDDGDETDDDQEFDVFQRKGRSAGGNQISAAEEEDEEQNYIPQRIGVSQKRKYSSRALVHHQFDEDEGGFDPDELREPSLDLEEQVSSSNKRTRFTADTVGGLDTRMTNGLAAISSRKGPSSSKRTGGPRSPASNSKKNKKKPTWKPAKKTKHPRPQPTVDADTTIEDLKLPPAVVEILAQADIVTLHDLKKATQGDHAFFEDGTDIPVEDLLSQLPATFLGKAKGSTGFSYEFNDREKHQQELEDWGMFDDVDPEWQEWMEKQRPQTQRSLLILRSAKVLVRALQCVDW